MVYNHYGIRISLAILLVFLSQIFFPIWPKPIMPQSWLHPIKSLLFRISKILIIICIILIPLQIKFITDKQIIVEKKLPVQILLDVSLSMAAQDIQPSRFTSAKNSLMKLVEKLEWYPISLIVFSWIPIIDIPFSTDAKAITSKLEEMNLWKFPPVADFLGTAIGDSLLMGVKNLQKQTNTWLIILITDGDSNKWYDPIQVLPLAIENKIPIFALGIGESNYLIWFDKSLTPVRTDINIPLLEEISKKTWWSFTRVLEQQNFDDFFQKIVSMIKKQEKQILKESYFHLNTIIFWLLLLECFYFWYLKISSYRMRKRKES